MTRVETHQGLTIVVAEQAYHELDQASLDRFRDQLLRVADEAAPPDVIVDLSAVSFFGSTFLAVLIEAWKRLQQRGGRLSLCGASEVGKEILHAARLDTVWKLYASRAEALAEAAGTQCYYLIVWLTVQHAADVAEVRSLLADCARLSRNEPGCLRYDVYQSQADPSRFLLVEHWQSQQAWQQHRAAEAFTQIYQPRVLPKVRREPHPSTLLL